MILPGILIYFIYSVMGSAIFGSAEAEQYAFKVYVSGESAVVQTIDTAIKQSGWTAEFVSLPAEGVQTVDEALEKVNSGEATALLTFSEGFDERSQASANIPHLQLTLPITRRKRQAVRLLRLRAPSWITTAEHSSLP